MKNYRVHAFMNNEKYGLFQTEYNDDRGQRFELIKNYENSTIYPSEEIANLVIETHKRTRQDELVQSYNLIEISG